MVSIPLCTPEEYQYGWKHARESTASSISRVHFRHYIVAIKDIIMEKINRLMATIQMLTGISPLRWRHALNVMLEKVAGNCSVEKLRIIMLFEADFNNNNKWLGWAVMRNTEKLDKVAPERYGSCSQESGRHPMPQQKAILRLHLGNENPSSSVLK